MRLIFVIGGSISGVGKGIAAASIGRILQSYGFSVIAVKIDPYINFDAGTLRPTEHGEVWVTDDGGEIDQDLGNYERFLEIPLSRKHNITTGQIYWKVIRDERAGKYLGQTVQFIPHIPNEIKRRIKSCAENVDFTIVEIGGTAGDYENLPFLFAAKSLEIELGKRNIAYVLVSYLPIPPHVGEMKTKPTQQAIRCLNETGIFPDFVICRAEQPIDEVRKHKIETYANIDADHVISAPDVKTPYEVPLNFERENLGIKLLQHFGLRPKKLPDWSGWSRLVSKIKNPSRIVKIAMVGKYIDIGEFSLRDAYISINQALEHAGASLDIGPSISWIDAKKIDSQLDAYDGIIIPGGFGASGIEGKIAAINWCRENDVPFLGLCLGMQLAVVEFGRNVCGLDCHSTEIDPNTPNPIINIMPSQVKLLEKSKYGNTMRLGAYAANLQPGSVVHKIYEKSGRLTQDAVQIEQLKKTAPFRLGILDKNLPALLERHRHRYEVNPSYIDLLTSNGLVFSGWHTREDGTRLMEFLELPKHRFFVATQAHPEFKSWLGNPAPLFLAFLEACQP
jgi:CTP synthase